MDELTSHESSDISAISMEGRLRQTVELFGGRDRAFSQIASALGYRTFSVDINPASSPDLIADIRTLSPSDLPINPLMVWAAPPDFAAFTDTESWDSDGSASPKNAAAEEAIDTFHKSVTLIAMMKPKWWFVENPKSLLRKMPITAGFNRGYPSRIRHTIRNDQYGGNGDAETDIWTNAYWWVPHPTESASNEEVVRNRRVPPYVFSEIFEQLADYQASQSART